MGMEPIRFHQVHGQNIRLSDDRSEAARIESFNQALCFTNRTLAPEEELVIKVIEASKSWSGTLRVGVTEHDPFKLLPNLPKYVCPDLNMRPGNWGKALEEHYVKLNQEIIIYHKNGRVMIREGDRMPEEFLTGVPPKKPLYILFDVYGNTKKIRISLKNYRGAAAAPAIVDAGAVAAEPLIASVAYGTASFSRASFLAFNSENVKVTPTCASGKGELSPRSHFAVTETLLKANETLVVRLKKLLNFNPIRIVLTTEKPLDVYEYGNLDKLCDNTYSVEILSETTRPGDELAISIARNGSVYVSHSNRRWMDSICVDPELKYSVVFDMENISEMLMIGISDNVKPETPVQNSCSPPDCIICLELPRTVLLEPCNHYALCDDCAKTLQKSERRECPICRAMIKGVKKIYMI